MVIAEKTATRLTASLKKDASVVIYYKGKYEFLDPKNNVVFSGNKKEMETFVHGYVYCKNLTEDN